MRIRRSLGFTLMEAMFAFMLVFMILGALNQTLINAAKVRQNTAAMDQAVEEFHALLTIKSDIEAALTIASPPVNSSGSRLILNRVNPDLTFTDRIDPVLGTADPFEPSEQLTITYEIQSDILRRLVRQGTASPVSHRLIPAKALRVERTGGNRGLVTVSLEIEGLRVTKTRVIKAAIRSL